MVKEGSKDRGKKEAWEWVPNERIGPIQFARPMSDIVELLDLRREKDDTIPGQDAEVYYPIPGMDKTAYDEDGVLETVITRDVFLYKGMNLIGMTESQIIELLDQGPSEIDEIDLADEEGGAPHRVFTFDELGLQVWSLEDRVESISCWQYQEEEDEDSNVEA